MWVSCKVFPPNESAGKEMAYRFEPTCVIRTAQNSPCPPWGPLVPVPARLHGLLQAEESGTAKFRPQL